MDPSYDWTAGSAARERGTTALSAEAGHSQKPLEHSLPVCSVNMESTVDAILLASDDLDDLESITVPNHHKAAEMLTGVNMKMVEDVCSSLADNCISVNDRPFFQSVPKLRVLEEVKFLDMCLVPKTKFIHTCREQAWRKYYNYYLQHMHSVTQLTNSVKASAWLCMQLFERLLEENYPLCSKSDEEVQCYEMSEETKDILNYIGGSILTKIKQKIASLCHSDKNEEMLRCLEVLEDKSSQASLGSKLTHTLNRGGLRYLKPLAQQFFQFLEVEILAVIRKSDQDQWKLSDFAERCGADENISSTFSSLVDKVETSQEVKDAIFSKMVQLYFKIRIHHECRMFMEKLKNKSFVKKGLRKNLKTNS